MIKLRAHHLLCLQLFTGKGYDEKFTDNMTQILARLCEGENFEKVDGADDICACCPNLIDGVCASNDKVERYDKGIAESLDLKSMRQYDFSEIQKLTPKEKLLKNVCNDCEWNGLCMEILK